MSLTSLPGFIARALKSRCAYIDMDGCLLRPMKVPDRILPAKRLDYWTRNLCATPVVKRRLPLLYLLRAMGVRLYWTNRAPQHKALTFAALGVHARLFSATTFFMAGAKDKVKRVGPCIDDDARYVFQGDLWVRPARSIGASASGAPT